MVHQLCLSKKKKKFNLKVKKILHYLSHFKHCTFMLLRKCLTVHSSWPGSFRCGFHALNALVLSVYTQAQLLLFYYKPLFVGRVHSYCLPNILQLFYYLQQKITKAYLETIKSGVLLSFQVLSCSLFPRATTLTFTSSLIMN